jgi:hypothetical protein
MQRWPTFFSGKETGSTQLYVDGVQMGPTYTQTPNLPVGSMMNGGNPDNAGETFLGGMDEVRLSLFAGRFDPQTMLLINAPAGAVIPEPSTIALAALGLLGLGLVGWRRRK